MNDLPLDDSMPVQPPALPPVNVAPQVPDAPLAVARWRWWLHLVLLASYVLGIGLIGWLESRPEPAGTSATNGETSPAPAEVNRPPVALSPEPVKLFATVGLQVGVFAVFFGGAWAASRASGAQLFLRWHRRRWLPVVLGAAYSVALRVIIGIVVVVAMAVLALIIMATQGIAFNQAGFDSVVTDLGKQMQPDVSHLVDKQALVESPLYVVLNMTVVSFGLAGLTEELWRAGMLAACAVLFPRLWSRRTGQLACVLVVALVFGLGHAPQGWGGVALTGLLGVLLGMIMIFHRSIWEAVLAHGFFNATSFLAMHLLFKYPDAPERLQRRLQELLAT